MSPELFFAKPEWFWDLVSASAGGIAHLVTHAQSWRRESGW
jgi:hypothetical protein